MSFQSIDEIEEALKSPGLSVRDLYTAWEQRQPVLELGAQRKSHALSADAPHFAWLQDNLSLAPLFIERAFEKEEFLLVCDAAREALRLGSDADEQERMGLVRVRMNYAAALSRLGFWRDARKALEPCVEADFRPRLERKLTVDILLKLANIMREESHQASEAAARLHAGEEALGFYQRALELEPDRLEALAFTAAALLILGGTNSVVRAEAHAKAREILTLTKKLENAAGARLETTWARAAAHSILGKIGPAAKSYGELQTIEGVTTAHLAEARFRAQFLAEALGKPRDFFKAAFPPLQLIVFSGHPPDLPGAPPRFPRSAVSAVRRLIRQKLAESDARVGLTSAFAGADLLFIEALRERSGIVHLILPWAQGEFRRTSVRPFDYEGEPSLWEPLFDEAIRGAATLREIGQVYEPGSAVGWKYLTEVSAGIALYTARASRLDIQPMALWDGLPARRAGGTESFVDFWRQQLQEDPIVLDMPALPEAERPMMLRRRTERSEQSTMRQQVKSILFADIVGYSKLTEHVIPEFVETFLGRVSLLIASSKHAPRSINTWGDAIHAVFDFGHDAGLFALELTQMVQEGRAEWLQKGLYWEETLDDQTTVKHPLSLRTGLHTGPVVMNYDPVTRRLGFTGSHVSRAARIEPVTKPGEVFASEEFAALAELDAEIAGRHAQDGTIENPIGARTFVCEYAGTMQLAKGYPGRHRIYRLQPKRVFAVEELAKAAHEAYCEKSRGRGETPATNSALVSWDELPEDLRDANRAQVADMANKLRFLGYELAPGHGSRAAEIKASDAAVEELAMREHDRWMNNRLRNGWTYSLERDNARKRHPLLIPWDELAEVEKEKDRDTVRNLPRLIDRAGLRVRKIEE